MAKTFTVKKKLPPNPFMHEILDLVSKQRSRAKKVEVLKEYETDALKSILIWNFDESVISVLPAGEVPYEKNDVPVGTHIYNVLDTNNCLFTSTYTIFDPAPISVVGNVTQHVFCSGDSTGSVDIALFGGGSAPNHYVWTNLTNDTLSLSSSASDLAAGEYIVSLTDSNNCPAGLDTVTITEPDSIIIYTTVTDLTCTGTNNGIINIDSITPSNAYNITWSNGMNNTSTIIGLVVTSRISSIV